MSRPPLPKSRKLDQMIALRLTRAEKQRVAKKARLLHVSLGTLARVAVLEMMGHE